MGRITLITGGERGADGETKTGRGYWRRSPWSPIVARREDVCTSLVTGGLNMHVNKVSHVTTIDRVAEKLGESVDFLHDVANEMEPENGVIWIYGLDD